MRGSNMIGISLRLCTACRQRHLPGRPIYQLTHRGPPHGPQRDGRTAAPLPALPASSGQGGARRGRDSHNTAGCAIIRIFQVLGPCDDVRYAVPPAIMALPITLATTRQNLARAVDDVRQRIACPQRGLASFQHKKCTDTDRALHESRIARRS